MISLQQNGYGHCLSELGFLDDDDIESSDDIYILVDLPLSSHLPEDQPPLVPVNSATNSENNEPGGPKTLDQLHLRVLSRDEHFVVLNKGPDVRMDGAFDVTLEKARGSRAHQKTPGYPRGVRHGPNLFTMEQAQLLRESQEHPRGEVRGSSNRAEARELTPAELAFTKMTWPDLTKEEKGAYTEKAKADKQRFLKEFSEFLSQEKVRLACKRKYESFDGEDSEEANEPVAYVFDAPIIEPHRSTGVFRMLVMSPTAHKRMKHLE
ncbi:uncharacterized protein PITG_13138 [Phytophthora infestans T30-4]|uniref:HMG box domain-containing protein n=1 Tax=Phytophthora infestans (strain T30-4) TaxID=403677 RepID=D0NJN9_PHYIT|nr:uncharacterized protein PITG_13138 [Phytophthora infestans T30-4]EEY59975.1 conserved hypothetical protein [Phytophthora infestans T30-4]|eukprot:XP_002900660.1 conserved hypothetical protein [Phytophthora infestans T30-4]